MAATLDYSGLLNSIWGSYFDGCSPNFGNASGIILGQNPPFSATDFFAMYPNFGGKSVTFTCTTDGSTGVLTAVSSTTGLTVGALIAAPGVPDGSTISAINAGANTVTINNNTTAASSGVSATAYPNPLVPIGILNAYIYLATSSLVQNRYMEMWSAVMAMFIAHYCTLWLQSQATTPNANAVQVATSGLALGIKTAKAAGNVSAGLTPLNDLEGWGTFQLTIYGQQFATIAKVIGSMPMLLY